MVATKRKASATKEAAEAMVNHLKKLFQMPSMALLKNIKRLKIKEKMLIEHKKKLKMLIRNNKMLLRKIRRSKMLRIPLSKLPLMKRKQKIKKLRMNKLKKLKRLLKMVKMLLKLLKRRRMPKKH